MKYSRTKGRLYHPSALLKYSLYPLVLICGSSYRAGKGLSHRESEKQDEEGGTELKIGARQDIIKASVVIQLKASEEFGKAS